MYDIHYSDLIEDQRIHTYREQLSWFLISYQNIILLLLF